MDERFDVVVVGARCAGSPVAMALAAQGLRVCLVDRAGFPSEVPSTHMIQPSGVRRLDRLGVLDDVLATGAPPLDRVSVTMDDVAVELGPGVFERIGGPALCVRRVSLDHLLVDHAARAGAEVRTHTTVVGLVEEGGRVCGVRTSSGTIRAALVVGADGPRSVVARHVGAREYHVTPPGRLFVWAYFEHADTGDGRVRLGKRGDLGHLAMPTDGGLFMAAVAPPIAARRAYVSDVDAAFTRALSGVPEVPDVLAGATRVGPVRVMARWHGYFREACGPGWVLVGDAGHFKDPTPGQGIADALRQGEHLAPVIVAGLGHGDLSDRLAAWWRWRDDDAWDMYWFATFLGAPGPTPRVAVEMIRSLRAEPEGPERFMRVLDHDLAPSAVFGPGGLARTLGRTSVTAPRRTPRLVAESLALARDQAGQRRLRRRPVFSPAVEGFASANPLVDARS